ncbi:hypothetical protein WV31_10600 [Magnetospirillum sp. ME-1]|uniref:hypothetical protein n=1 Tax=Magnetospirillum sp. ME-1 TaxID=1639348 RepID=UPI000A17D962|nr:hypothetical protein [Magnetospirillum sp. ME-1]ARJ66077.1 hypothetical protein WV31_10600 [Magnetospirillum sp. ME-1]
MAKTIIMTFGEKPAPRVDMNEVVVVQEVADMPQDDFDKLVSGMQKALDEWEEDEPAPSGGTLPAKSQARSTGPSKDIVSFGSRTTRQQP